MQQDRFAARLFMVTLAVVIVLLVWRLLPLIEAEFLAYRAEPRLVSPRAELAQDEAAVIAVFRQSRDSVVSISTRERVYDYWSRNAYDVPRGTGSGFVWDEYGHIVTNNHVVAGASAATVRLANGEAYRARLVGTDPTHDLAVLRIEAEAALPPLPIGTSADLEVGQKVLAIGNPFGLDWTLTTGVISALGRELPEGSGLTIRGLIQTDAAINPGNSGGPLIDSAGRLVGVNTAIYSPSGSSAGIGFAVPVDTVNRVVPQLIRSGAYAPPSFGAEIDPRVDDVAARIGIRGALLLGVVPGSPAARAGLEAARIAPDGRLLTGDVVIGLDGEPIGSVADLSAALDRRAVGDEVTLTLQRGGERRDVTLPLVEGR
jgi:S1-C subfamily serine protease